MGVWVLGLPLEFITLAFLYVTFVFVVTTFATIATGDGTPEMILMGHRFPIPGMLLSFHLQHTATAVIAVRGMTRPPLVINRFCSRTEGVYLHQVEPHSWHVGDPFFYHLPGGR